MKKLLLALLLLSPLSAFAVTGQLIPFLSWNSATGTSATTTSLFSTNASTSNLWLGAGTGCLQITNGQVVSTGSACGSGGGGAYPFQGSGNSTSTLTGFTGGLFAYASSTFNNFTFFNATGTSATTTNFFATTASSTNIYTNIGNSLVLSSATGLLGAYSGVTCTNQFLRALSGAGASTCATVGSADVSLATLTATDATLTFSGSYNGSTARTIGINLGNANTWTAQQTFSNANAILATGSTTLQNFTGINSTSTNATTTGSHAFGTQNTFTGINSNQTNTLDFWTTNTWRGGFSPVGSLGIGTTTPQWQLQLASTTGPQLTLSDPTTLTTNHWSFRNVNGVLGIATSSPSTFATSSATALAIDTSGVVTVQGRNVFATDKAFAFASSTLAYAGSYGASASTTLYLYNPSRAVKMLSFYCKTTNGTAHLAFGNGTSSTTDANCSTSGVETTGVNKTWTTRQDFMVEVGRITGTPNFITVTATIEE